MLTAPQTWFGKHPLFRRPLETQFGWLGLSAITGSGFTYSLAVWQGWTSPASTAPWFAPAVSAILVETIQQTIAFSKSLPLDFVIFHIAAPYPATPFFYEVVENGWFRPGTNWKEIDMDRSTVLDYEHLSAEDLGY